CSFFPINRPVNVNSTVLQFYSSTKKSILQFHQKISSTVQRFYSSTKKSIPQISKVFDQGPRREKKCYFFIKILKYRSIRVLLLLINNLFKYSRISLKAGIPAPSI